MSDTDWDRIDRYCKSACGPKHKYVDRLELGVYPEIVIIDNNEIWFYFDTKGKLINVRTYE